MYYKKVFMLIFIMFLIGCSNTRAVYEKEYISTGKIIAVYCDENKSMAIAEDLHKQRYREYGIWYKGYVVGDKINIYNGQKKFIKDYSFEQVKSND